MNDPLSPLSAPPPRYLLESDSSDEEGQGQYPLSGPSRPKIRTEAHDIQLAWSNEVGPVDTVVLGVGQAGRYLAKKAGLGGEAALHLTDGGKGVGRGWAVGTDLVLGMDETEGGVWETSKALLSGIKAKTWVVLSTYLPSMYISDESSSTSSDPPIRYLYVSGDDPADILRKAGIERFTSPNHLTGLPAAIASTLVHPACPLPASTSLTLLLLPLPLSSIPTSSVISALRALQSGLAVHMGRVNKAGSGRWDEGDDEPFIGPGMGGGKRSGGREVTKEDVSGMYM